MKNLIIISLVLTFIWVHQIAEAQQDLAQEAYLILEQSCFDCHGPHGAFTENFVIESASQLVDSGAVVRRKPIESELYRRLLDKDPAKRMPLGQPQLPPAAILTLGNWIQAGAPSWEVEHDVNFIPMDAMLDTIKKHVESLPRFDRASARYFTTTHLYNAGESPETLRAYQLALSKLVNSLSWGSEIVKPVPIDARKTIFYIDLRRYEWDVRNDAWTQIEQEYPYSIEFDSETQAGLLKKLTDLREEMECDVPFVHADWFLATASLPPLYHDILDLPETDRELERELGIDVQRNLQSAPGVRVWRAGLNDSGVSENNRVVERHRFQHGAYWKSYDFAGNVGVQNIIDHPLTFRHDGGEIIFNLPNGLQAYYISDASGSRIDAAPTTIVSNPDERDGIVRNGISCIGCHTEGMKTFEDDVRVVVMRAPESAAKVQALRLYVAKAKMDELLSEDTQTYRRALEATGDVFGGIEPVYRFYKAFENPVDAAHAAAAIGLETETFIAKIREKPSLQRLGLRTLESANGNVKRDAWTSNFSDVVSALNSPENTVRPPTPVDDLKPGDLVSIPDVNLRTAVESALGKPAGTLITAADMARLERLEADEAGIRNLIGLEAATRLERIEFRHNVISDLSPLSGLTRLNNIKLRGNRITDVSPLAKLINVEWMGLEENQITDLSPLKGLVKLNGLGIAGNPVSNVVSLTGLLSLEGIDALRTDVSNFAPLAKLPRLQWLEFGDNASISELPSLKGLKTLRRLVIRDTRISDVSGLEGLGSLTELNLERNVISDVSPLAKLTRLKRLELNGNVISDVSPLAGLTNLEHLNLQNNVISDFSPLKRLSDKISIRTQDNPGFFVQGGPKITGPWLWMLFPGAEFDTFRTADLLARASGGDVTERKIATHGAAAGESVGDSVWISQEVSADDNNINRLLEVLNISKEGNRQYVIYGSITLNSPRAQNTKMFAGSDDNHKVWLNGGLVDEKLGEGWAHDYERSFPVTLKQGKNVLLVAIHEWGGGWAGHFGFAPDAEYTVFAAPEQFSLSTQATQIGINKTFTLQLKTNNITDLAGWQADITFDPNVLKANSVSEGNFLKQKSGRTHFRKGTIDNQKGKIAGISSARISQGGVDGAGTLLSITFTAKAAGETRVALREFQAGSSLGKTILSRSPDTIITVGAPSTASTSTSDASDTGFSLSTDGTPVPFGDTFTLRLSAEKIVDLAGWQTDITFDPDVLEAVEVNEGDFLKTGGEGTFFLRGTIDNQKGEITQISSARLSGGINGTGTLLSVTFTAKAVAETRIRLSNLHAGDSSTAAIPLNVPELVITVDRRAFPAWDVNQDGQVNVLDLIAVAQHLGTAASLNSQADVNGDRTINVLDLIAVAQHLGESSAPAAPSNIAIGSLGLDPATIQAWIAQAQIEDDGSIAFRQAIANLEQLLALFIPEETALLHNYPNPFNPETWIPYHLAEPAEVTIRIYAASGVLVRTLALGYQPAGIYQYRSRAAYWDGKNAVGESVASGVYFFTLTAGDFTATRKMLIRK
ncbi:leucine-rich repeat domain-containing protein [Candidatus Poribacteria bacterium]|nr:leucine-rich repeat domain-containing protein [Candidatus Poribacteria bacterium]